MYVSPFLSDSYQHMAVRTWLSALKVSIWKQESGSQNVIANNYLSVHGCQYLFLNTWVSVPVCQYLGVSTCLSVPWCQYLTVSTWV